MLYGHGIILCRPNVQDSSCGAEQEHGLSSVSDDRGQFHRLYAVGRLRSRD